MNSAQKMRLHRAAKSEKPEPWAERVAHSPFLQGVRNRATRHSFSQRRETVGPQRRETVEHHGAGASAPASLKGNPYENF